MTDNSGFELLWEVDNASTRLATGKAESGDFSEGGFKWDASIRRRIESGVERADFTLRCAAPHSGPWKCEADVELTVLALGRFFKIFKNRVSLNEKNSFFLANTAIQWQGLTTKLPSYLEHDNVTFRLQMQIIDSDGGAPAEQPCIFDAPNNRSDVILLLGDKKVHVNKELLALHSPYFETLFFGDFAEKDKDEIRIYDVYWEEFIDLLHVIYPGSVDITDRTVHYIMKLADRFQMKRVMHEAVKHLMQSSKIIVAKKLILADKYKIYALREHVLSSLKTVPEVIEKCKSPQRYVLFSNDMKTAICDYMMKLSQ